MTTPFNIATLPAYYALYALYFDYDSNNASALAREDLERVRESARIIQPLLGLVQPYHKSWALRLFTERASLDAYAPELVDEAWRQLRQLVEHLGPPPGWEPPPSREGWLRRRLADRVFPYRPPAPEPAVPEMPLFPHSPIDCRQAV
jgi:hypothetical protein